MRCYYLFLSGVGRLIVVLCERLMVRDIMCFRWSNCLSSNKRHSLRRSKAWCDVLMVDNPTHYCLNPRYSGSHHMHADL